MTKRLAWFVPAFLVAIGLMAFVAACGGGDDKLSSEDYYKKLETLSQDVDKKLADAGNKTPESQEPDALKSYIESALDSSLGIIEDAAKQLGDLKPPDDVKPKHDAFVTAVNAEIAKFKTVKETLSNTEADQIEAVLGTLDLDTVSAASDAACSALQADAGSKSITVDLKCGD